MMKVILDWFGLKLLDNWKAVLTKAWSMWLMVMAIILTMLEYALPLLIPPSEVPSRWMTLGVGAIIGLAFAARLFAQRGVTNGYK